MSSDPLRTALLDLDHELGGKACLVVAGGFGLYLKQIYLKEERRHRTLIPIDSLPSARTTNDIDLMLRTDVVVDVAEMRRFRAALDQQRFVEEVKFLKFSRATVAGGTVGLDLLTGPLGDAAPMARISGERVRPREVVELHARLTEDAVGVSEYPFLLPVKGRLSTGEEYETTVSIPQAFTYLVMKLSAFRDRLNDPDKNEGRHHALDAFRAIGLLTDEEDPNVRRLAEQYRDHAIVSDARRIVADHFGSVSSLGVLRIREHPLAPTMAQIELFLRELGALLPPIPHGA